MALFRSLRTPAACLVLALSLSTCGDDGTSGPEPGWLTVELQSPFGAEGAALFFVDQPVLDVSQAPLTIFTEEVQGGVRIAVLRATPGGLDFRIEVEDIDDPPTVELLEVAGPDDELRANIDTYRVELRR